MRKFTRSLITLVLAAIFIFQYGNAQQFDEIGQYMNYISKANEKITMNYLSYMSAVGHSKSARKVDKRRQEVLTSIFDTRFDIMGMPPWKGDRSYRDTTVAYMKLLYNVFNEDYAKIVNMEEIAEQSYDAMEAYMLAQQKAGEKLVEASAKQQKIQKEFAAKYNVNIVDELSALEIKSKQAGDLMRHYNDVYLVFFKAYKQEAYLTEAVNKKNINAIEQNKNALFKFAEEGLKKLPGLKGYNDDPSLIVACRTALNFYKAEAEKAQIITDFFLKEDAFSKLKKKFDSKPAPQRTQQDIDEFNKGVSELNASVATYNNNNSQINKDREKCLDTWNKAVKKYLDTYMPVQKKT